jgi:hypothetical protein
MQDVKAADLWEKRAEPVRAVLQLAPQGAAMFHKRFAKFAKIAERHGQEVSCERLEDVLVPHPFFRKRKVAREQWAVVIPPMVGVKGRICGHFELAEDGKSQYVHVFKEDERAAVEALLPRAGECDHCQKKRNRVKSFVVEHEGAVQIVGSNCLMDYLGVDPGWALACCGFYDEMYAKSERDEAWGGPGFNHELLIALVEEAYKVAKMWGGYPGGEDRYAFRNEVGYLLHGGGGEQGAEVRAKYRGFEYEPLDVQALADYVERAKGDFGRNLQIAFGQEYVHLKRSALVIAGVAMWVGRALKLKDEVKKAPAKAFEEAPGKRVDFEAELVRVHPFVGAYGSSLILNFRCADDRQAVMFYSGQGKPEAGKRYKVRASIKRHQACKYGEGFESVLNRPVFEEVK